jgi:hypothetical protein
MIDGHRLMAKANRQFVENWLGDLLLEVGSEIFSFHDRLRVQRSIRRSLGAKAASVVSQQLPIQTRLARSHATCVVDGQMVVVRRKPKLMLAIVNRLERRASIAVHGKRFVLEANVLNFSALKIVAATTACNRR